MTAGVDQFGVHWRGFRAGVWAAAAGVVIAVLVLVLAGQPVHAAELVGFAAVVYAFVLWMDHVPPLFALILIAADLISTGMWVWHVNRSVSYYDEIVHGFSSFAITLVFAHWIYYSLRHEFRKHRGLLLLAVMSFGLWLGAIWEMVEWVGFEYMGPGGTVSRTDTVSDLSWDALGSGLASILVDQAYRHSVEDERG